MLKEKIISKSKDLNFNLIGFTKFKTLQNESEHLREWLAKGYNAGMHYMEENIEKKMIPKIFLRIVKV